MERKIITTSDGSTTIQIVDWNEQYHSIHGAIQEAYHVFITKGLSLYKDRAIAILEIGFGTGLNALITYIEAQNFNLKIDYTGVEAYPVSPEEIKQLNYIAQLEAQKFQEEFDKMHTSEWEKSIAISSTFSLLKQQKDFMQITDKAAYDLIYFDAFGARVQPELWTEEIFKIMYAALNNNGVLVTYAAKGSVRRAMLAVGFEVERLDGPPGKREMLRATKK
ncbi:tRNA (5-methylaminomethyl-2-thiouridine)(34)-methyltransferase MnmD [Cellulophaga baltica]|uniref:tRNA U34 5-methylaminomethyl-2-thiouridine-forming methyltransferase MnmC n=2 Tax=Cellulophaga baltica TaxID=76594 RepID=A0A1G7JRU8_9FLAO|nr:tRNA (5-methylaminomethyl-2-thiouridine)(34)-methyltransferase MnmD [Cellulophaga baltica]AIZ43498.1 SAM-dependent methyltransferase [Cellulophaga baltica 18]MCR1024711.1 tRNA (5-methylaminomethyl-2-thiouridine)(34)-methyltransferase MnmD [Cellulophaga baltica]WFO16053.1 tRNA (5-methylaminomethyl-2-thiouridine)(34)-methyltransferase MnmD [Cellulophaga baltica 4]SDF27591.1 tRNA U34 5-methylaminomethyl-2-thiouridine-forming methyltransferase MnmC [Cellulophaga baltica]